VSDEQVSAPPVDRLLHITDLHFWEIVWNPFKLLNKRMIGNLNVAFRRRHEFNCEAASACAQRLVGTGVKTVFAGGDFTSTATDEEFVQAVEFLRALKRLDIQVIVAPGNHDRYTFEAMRKRRFETYFEEFLPDGGYPAQFFLPGGTPFIVLDQARPNILSSRGYVSGESLEKTARLLEGLSSDRVLVGGHFPILHRTLIYQNGWTRQLGNALALRHLLGMVGKRVLYLSGHVHRQSLEEDPQYPSLVHLTTSAFFMRHREGAAKGGFSEILVGTEGFSVTRHASFI